MWNVLRWLGSCLLLAALGVVLLVALVPRLTGVQLVTVLSDSMSPAFERGAMLVVRPVDPAAIKVGDVIVYRQAYDPNSTVAHRVTAVNGDGSSVGFETKGDANEMPDRGSVPAADVVGKVAYDVPLLGHVVRHLRTPLVFLLMIGVPGVLIIGQEVWNITKVLRRKDSPAEAGPETENP
jgi:signal peptidase